LASSQESHVQNRNRSQSYPQSSFFDQVFAAARARAERGADEGIVPGDDESGEGERALDELLDVTALLRTLREPVDWLLALAHRLAAEDPIDIAAIARVHTAFHARINGQPARVRTSDVLLVLGLLMTAFDPRLVLRVVSGAASDARATETPMAFFVASPEPIAPSRPPRTPGSRPTCCAFHALLVDLL